MRPDFGSIFRGPEAVGKVGLEAGKVPIHAPNELKEKKGLFVSRKIQIEKRPEIVFACLRDTTLHALDGIPQKKLTGAISAPRNQMHLKSKCRPAQRIGGQDALGVLGEPYFFCKRPARAARKFALMRIFFPSCQGGPLSSIEQHEADIVEDSRLETVIEFDPAGPCCGRRGVQIKPGGGALTPDVQARVPKAGISVET